MEYSSLTGLNENNSPYFKAAMGAIDISLCYHDNMYDCDFRYNKKTFKGCRIVLSLFNEFSYYHEVVVGMIGLIEFFEENIEKLRQVIESLKGSEAAA